MASVFYFCTLAALLLLVASTAVMAQQDNTATALRSPTPSPSRSRTPVAVVRSSSASPSRSPSASKTPSPSPSPIDPRITAATQMLMTHTAQQLFQNFWMEIRATLAVLAVENLPTSEAQTRFAAIVNKYCTDDVRLEFPLYGVDVTGKDAFTAAIVAQVDPDFNPDDGGNGGEHQVTSFPVISGFVPNSSITLTSDDAAFVRRRNNDGYIFLGRKTWTSKYQADWNMKLSYLLLEVRSDFPIQGGLPTWNLLTKPFVEQ